MEWPPPTKSKNVWFEEPGQVFDWISLASKPKQIVCREEHVVWSLQDYWRLDFETGQTRNDDELMACGLLEEVDGVLWHIVHLPQGLGSKGHAHDSCWDKVYRLVSARAKAGARSAGLASYEQYAPRHGIGPDRRAQLYGVVVDRSFLTSEHRPAGEAGYHVVADYMTCVGNADHSGVHFGSAASFNHSTWHGITSFRFARFDDVAHFWHARFLSHATFGRARFAADLVLEDVVAMADLDFTHACLLDELWSAEIRVAGNLILDGATLSGAASLKKLNLGQKARIMARNVISTSRLDLSELRTSGARYALAGAFDGAILQGGLEMRGTGHELIPMLAGARVQGNLSFDEGTAKRLTFRELRRRRRTALVELRNSPSIEDLMASYEHGARVAKVAMESVGDAEGAQAFAQAQLSARRLRPNVGCTEKVALAIFYVLARYGYSVTRPLLWLAATLILFAVLFLVANARVGPVMSWSDIAEAMHYSLGRVLPFNTLDTNNFKGAWTSGLLARTDITRTFLDFAASLETVIAGSLLFLVGLAIRRKFKLL